MWDSRSTGESTSVMSVLFIIIIIWAIFGGGLWGNNSAVDAGCNRVSNCEVEKQTIINTATTQNLINENANRVVEANNTNTQRLYDQSARQWEAQLQETIFDSKLRESTVAILNDNALKAKDAENAILKQTIDQNEKFYMTNRRLDSIECNMLKKPELFGQAFVTCGQPIPTNSYC